MCKFCHGTSIRRGSQCADHFYGKHGWPNNLMKQARRASRCSFLRRSSEVVLFLRRPQALDEGTSSTNRIHQSRSVQLRRVTLASEGGDVTVGWFDSLSKLLSPGSLDEPERSSSLGISADWSVGVEVSMCCLASALLTTSANLPGLRLLSGCESEIPNGFQTSK